MRMGRYGRHSLIVLILLCIALACDGGSGNSTTTRTIGPEGGTITSSDGKLTLEIPEGALDQDTEITIKKLNDDDISEQFAQEMIDCAYELGPEGLTFNIPVSASVRLNENPNQEDGTVTGGIAFLFTESGELIEFLENPELEFEGDGGEITVTAELTHFTELVTVMSNGITATLDMVKQEDVPDTFTGTVTVSSSASIEDLEGGIAINQTGATLSRPRGFGNLPIPSTGGMTIGTINGQCVEEKGFETYIVRLTVEQIDLVSLFTFAFVRPEIDVGPVGDDDDLFGFSSINIIIKSILACIGPGGIPTFPPPPLPSPSPSPPPPPLPTNMPTLAPPPPVPMIDDLDGLWMVDCISEQDPFGIIAGNLGIPVVLDVEIDVNFETGAVTITTSDGLFVLMGTVVDQQNGIFVINAQGSGFLGGMPPVDANIVVKAENWNFVVNELGEIVFTDGQLRFNFPGLPLNSQSSVASCFGEMVE